LYYLCCDFRLVFASVRLLGLKAVNGGLQNTLYGRPRKGRREGGREGRREEKERGGMSRDRYECRNDI
jgi:hypothetical protein